MLYQQLITNFVTQYPFLFSCMNCVIQNSYNASVSTVLHSATYMSKETNASLMLSPYMHINKFSLLDGKDSCYNLSTIIESIISLSCNLCGGS